MHWHSCVFKSAYWATYGGAPELSLKNVSVICHFNFSPIGEFGWCYVNNKNHWGFCSRSCIMSQTPVNELVCEICLLELFCTKKKDFPNSYFDTCPTLAEMKQACDLVNPPLGLFCRNTSLFKWWIQTNVEIPSSQR